MAYLKYRDGSVPETQAAYAGAKASWANDHQEQSAKALAGQWVDVPLWPAEVLASTDWAWVAPVTPSTSVGYWQMTYAATSQKIRFWLQGERYFRHLGEVHKIRVKTDGNANGGSCRLYSQRTMRATGTAPTGPTNVASVFEAAANAFSTDTLTELDQSGTPDVLDNEYQYFMEVVGPATGGAVVQLYGIQLLVMPPTTSP
jgi:hypothetical protein